MQYEVRKLPVRAGHGIRIRIVGPLVPRRLRPVIDSGCARVVDDLVHHTLGQISQITGA